MSLFRKPKRNIARRKDSESHDEDLADNSTENIINTANKDGQTSLGPKVPEQTKLLSFGEAWNEGDDGEVFKVRKTSQSKKIRKQFEKKNAEKNKKDIDKVMHINNAHKIKAENENYEELTIKIKNPIAGPVATSDRILSGISAEMAGYESGSDDDYDNTNHDNGGQHKFNQQNEFKILLQSGKIPDAAFIHAARKRRQQARETGTNYIPLEEEKIKENNESKSRLVRDDDSDEEERISMAGIVTNASEIEKRKEDFEISIDSDDDNEDNKDDSEWICQQIRKGVGTQLNSVPQENMYQQNGNNIITPSNTSLVTPSFNSVDHYFSQLTTNESTEQLEPDDIVKKLRERYENMDEFSSKRDSDFANMNEEIMSLNEDREKRIKEHPNLIKRFNFYQILRGYVNNLVACFDEKVTVINTLEERVVSLIEKKAKYVINRRRQDVKDQMDELNSNKNNSSIMDDDHVRRTADRDGRRIRRIKKRSMSLMTSHVDGMSSDDEITEAIATSYREQQNVILTDANIVMDDVREDFSSIEKILYKFFEWKETDCSAYVEAYANICLPKILGPLVRLDILMWNPLLNERDVIIDNFEWLDIIMNSSSEKDITIEYIKNDPDMQLIPRIIDKTIVPKLKQIVIAQYDPISSSQTKRLITVIKNLIEYPSIGTNSKFFSELIKVVVEKIDLAINNDVFIPILPHTSFDAGKLNVFFQRQFAQIVKLYGNVLCWHGILNDDLLIEKANQSILNKYLLMAIRLSSPIEAINKCYLVHKCWPESWLKTNLEAVSSLQSFILHCKQIIPQLDCTNPHGREAIEKISEILKSVRNISEISTL